MPFQQWLRQLLPWILLLPGVACADRVESQRGAGNNMQQPPANAATHSSLALPQAASPSPSTTDSTCSVLAVVRDFRGHDEPQGHPDFENYNCPDVTPGLVAAQLGSDGKPAYADHPQLPKPCGEQLSGREAFDAWYRDVDGVNQPFVIDLPLVNGIYESDDFFPIDGRGFGNRPGGHPPHNFHFTTEIHVQFVFEQAKQLNFSFFGDDDLWIFVNGKLALDLGGLHGSKPGTIDFNAQAAALGLVDGQTYEMAIFHAERHTYGSRFRVETNIPCFRSVLL